MKWKKTTIFVIAIVFLMVISGFSGMQVTKGAEKDDRINPLVDGPEEVFVNVTEVYQVEIKGVFEVNGNIVDVENANNWTLKTESSLDATVKPKEQESSTSNHFTVNVTVHEAGKGYLNITAYCGKKGKVSYSEKQVRIKAEKPQKTTVPINNPTNTTVEEMRLGLFIDGKRKSTITVTDLKSGEEKTVTFKWSKSGLSSGEHDLEVWVDYGVSADSSGFTKQDQVIDSNFHVKGETNTLLYGGIIAAVIASGFVVFLLYQQRKRKRRRPW